MSGDNSVTRLPNKFKEQVKKMRVSLAASLFAGIALSLGASVSLCSAQINGSMINGHRIIVPDSSIPRPGRIHTNYFIVDSGARNNDAPPPDAETPASLACVYKLVKGIKGCPIATSKNVPTGGVGAIAIVDAAGHKPPVYSNWEVEEALDIEWAHAMAPKAKLFLVESKLCTSNKCNTDPTWQAVKVAGELVAKNGGGVVSMSFGDAEWAQERQFDHYMTTPGVVYFAASGDGGIGFPIHPGASPNVVSVGGTFFNRDSSGNFINEQYYTGGGGGGISLYEPRPSYQDVIKKIVGSKRGTPDVASDFCCAAIYLQGWGEVGGTSWSSPTFAGIVSAASQ